MPASQLTRFCFYVNCILSLFQPVFSRPKNVFVSKKWKKVELGLSCNVATKYGERSLTDPWVEKINIFVVQKTT
jgi:hypothetical protein